MLLCTTRRGRDALRAAGTYPILQKLHLWEFNDDVKEAVERVVDLLQRDEEKKKENSTNNVGNSVNALPCSRRIEEVSSDEEDEQGEEEEEGQIDIDEII